MIREIYHTILIYIINFFVKIKLPEHTANLGSILIIAPHPDDEVFGAGGIILQTLHHGKDVNIVYLTDGEATGVHPDRKIIRQKRAEMTETVREALGIPLSHIHRLHIADGRVPYRRDSGFEQIVSRLVQCIDTLSPDTVLATHELDYWPYDHVACAELATEAVVRSHKNPDLYFYWVWAWYNLKPKQLLTLGKTRMTKFSLKRWKKKKASLVTMYLEKVTSDGKPWSGQLPKSLIRSFFFNVEVLEKRKPSE